MKYFSVIFQYLLFDSLHYEKFVDGSVKCIEDEIPFELPDGWAWARIYSITEDLPYGTAKKSMQKGLVAVLRMGNIQSGEIDYSDLVYSSDINDIEKYTLVKNDLLFNRTNSAEWVGKTAIYRGNMPAIYAGYLIRVRTFINPEYLNVVMNSGYAKVYCNLVKTDGVNQSNINAQKLGNFLVPIPSIDEQKRISSSIIKIIPRVSLIREEKEHIVDLIQQTKAKILDLAIRGQLVPQNPDDEPASVLLERICAEKEELIKQGKIKRDKKESIIFKGEDNSYYEAIGKDTVCIDEELPFDIPEGWGWSRLQNISSVLTDGTHKTPTYSDEGYIFLSSKNVTTGKIDWENVMYIPESLHVELYKRLAPMQGDILLAKNGTTGVAALVDKDTIFDIYVSLAPIRLIGKKLHPQYILNVIGSSYVQEYFKRSLKGIGVPNLHLEHIRKTLIPIPPYAEQKQIVEFTNKMSHMIEKISDSIL